MAETHLEKLEKNIWNKVYKDLAGRHEEYFKEQLRISVRQFYQALLGYKPVTQVHLIA
jgi:predicted secreted Zn-dependent protease